MTTTFYKVVEMDGTDFWTGHNCADALNGDPIKLPVKENPDFMSDDTIHAFTNLTGSLRFHSTGWPWRLFEVTGEPLGYTGSAASFFELSVIRELDPYLALGPQGREIIALIERAKTLTEDEIEGVWNAWATNENLMAVPHASSAAHAAAYFSIRTSVFEGVYRPIKEAVLESLGHDDTRERGLLMILEHTVCGLVVRDLVGQHHFTQEYYDSLTRYWRTVIGPAHPDDAEMA